MKALLVVTAILAILALGWATLGWVALIVLPFGTLFALMTFALPVLGRAQGQAEARPFWGNGASRA